MCLLEVCLSKYLDLGLNSSVKFFILVEIEVESLRGAVMKLGEEETIELLKVVNFF